MGTCEPLIPRSKDETGDSTRGAWMHGRIHTYERVGVCYAERGVALVEEEVSTQSLLDDASYDQAPGRHIWLQIGHW